MKPCYYKYMAALPYKKSLMRTKHDCVSFCIERIQVAAPLQNSKY